MIDLVRRHGVPAAQLAIHMNGRTVAVTAGGVTADAKFPVGSITKAFTASVAMLLVADGDLDVDDRIGTYLAELGTEADSLGGMVTVRQILSHTSGLPSSFGERLAAVASPRQYLRDCRELTLVQLPGVRFSYSNVGYVLIGRIVEEITGMSWWDAIQALLLKPLRVVPSFVVWPDSQHSADSFVSGHVVNEATGTALPVAQTIRVVEAPCGALALSATDLVAFGHAHLTGCGDPSVSAPLDAEAFREMRRPVSGAEPFGLADGWGLGLAVFRDVDADWVGHDGTADGTSCHLRIDPTRDRVIALTANANTGSSLWEELVDELRALDIPVGDYIAPELTSQIPAPGDLFGSYVNGEMEYAVDAGEGGEATLSVDGETYPELILHEDWAFSVRQPASGRRILGGRFLRDPSGGQVSGIQTGGRVAGRLTNSTCSS
ncbi:MAG TPA: serine hydrolase domain-containing protein [Actinophytocola sp.]|uniref:serine hydrolase domain-containing protein n=1 Tax=Actinophytocola sp. TaxID=1872138 RepID=UPI002DBDE117|nr:serine hydrolase domain-containing protein [Actinophytocola sp.]HEU5476171.1 serine hydrolase domain-containing protein [Actinophytocola sp.]